MIKEIQHRFDIKNKRKQRRRGQINIVLFLSLPSTMNIIRSDGTGGGAKRTYARGGKGGGGGILE